MAHLQEEIDLSLLVDDAGSLGYEICKLITHKGFCTLSTGLTEEQLRQAREETKQVQNRERFNRPPSSVAEGLLGSLGSAEIAEISPAWASREEDRDGPMLMDIDSMVSDVVSTLLPHCPGTLGFDASERTTAWLHRCDEDPLGIEEQLDEWSASKWINQFVRQRLVAFIFLGPKGGLLETRPHDRDSGAYDVKVDPGTMIILRSDLLSHHLSARNGEMVLSMWFMTEDFSGVRGALNVGAEKIHPRTPIVRSLMTWAWNRLLERKAQQQEGISLEWGDDIPRGWQLASSRRLSREATKCAVRGIGFKVPGVEDFDMIAPAHISGSDFGIEVPIRRWDHALYYDPDPECWMKERFKTSVKHCCMVEGADLFDNKFFGISNLEAKVMEPVQKNTMEDTYKALNQAGYTMKGEKDKIKLSQKYIGIYTGSDPGEYGMVPHEAAGGMAGSEGSPAIVSNRISFQMGLMGPSYTLQLEAASALMAVYEGAFDLMPSNYKSKPMPDAAACQGVYIMLSPFWWGVYMHNMNPMGRCFAFGENANGHIRSEASSSVVLKRHGEIVDNKFVVDDSYETFGFLTGWACVNHGRSASLNAPNSQALQMVVLDALRAGGIAPADVDAVACHSEGLLLHDAVEVTALSKMLRGDARVCEETLDLSNSACRMGQSQEAYGLTSLLMMMSYQVHGFSCGNLHLKALNPYVGDIEAAVNFVTEALPMRCRTSYAGVNAMGFCGVSCHIQMSNEVDEKLCPRRTLVLERNSLSFWPGGGGQIGYSAEPMRGYSILGSWSCWEDLEPMTAEGSSGAYSFVVTLGENRCEQFVILLDGDRSRTLHPGCAKASLGTAACGPDVFSDAEGYSWLLDGRSRISEKPQMSLNDASDELGNWEACEIDTPYTGVPGDQYRVQLQIAGKWRAVTWEKTGSRVETPKLGKYFICASWNDWTLEEMNVEDVSRGVHSLELCLLESTDVFFQIIRNKDTDQTLYPFGLVQTLGEGCSVDDVHGPDEFHAGHCWKISGSLGDVIKIEFERTFDQGVDSKRLSCKHTGHREPHEERARRETELKKKAAERRAREEREAEELEALLRTQA